MMSEGSVEGTWWAVVKRGSLRVVGLPVTGGKGTWGGGGGDMDRYQASGQAVVEPWERWEERRDERL